MRYIFILLLFTACATTKNKQSRQASKDSLNTVSRKDTSNTREGFKRVETNNTGKTSSYEKTTDIIPQLLHVIDSLGRSKTIIVPTTRIVERGQMASSSQQVITDTAYRQSVNAVLTEITSRLLTLEESESKEKQVDVSGKVMRLIFGVLALVLIIAGLLLWYTIKSNKKILGIVGALKNP